MACIMASFSSLCLYVSILRSDLVTSNGSCRATGLATDNFLRSLFISLFEPIFMSVLLTKILLLYPSFFSMAKIKLLGSIYIYLLLLKNLLFRMYALAIPDIFLLSIDKSPFIKSLNVSLKTF